MRARNWRVLATGLVVMAAAVAFFLGMQTTAPRSTDPVELMRTVGLVSGVAGGIGLMMVIIGLVGRRSRA